MIPVTLAQLARDCDGQVVGTPTTEILDLTTDTRAITPGAIFAAQPAAEVICVSRSSRFRSIAVCLLSVVKW